ncbi:hypothetical protein H5410_042372 [Solanum commersonii]|uniref:Uncharacterized protein n=1 Tax=Solanum commersonii TaxID=4109 RepID=A0A9J5XVU6_SOLCO|nr:hypothetical protein H5410_042372 [Solanum commersonii]
MKVVEIRMLQWMCEHIRRDRIRNEDTQDTVRVVPMEDNMREARLRWFGHVKRRCMDARSSVDLRGRCGLKKY